MIFEIISDHSQLSYLLCKHPDGNFDRIVSKQKITGKYLVQNHYQVTIENDRISFIKLLKQLNKASYVSDQFDGVCPYNLRGVYEALSSAISNVYSQETQEFSKKTCLTKIVFGPLAVSKEFLISMFAAFNLKIIFEEELQFAYIASVSDMGPLYLLLQKVYMLLFTVTSNKRLFKLQNENIQKFIRLTQDWIETSNNPKVTKKIIRKLTDSKSDYMDDMIESIQDEVVRTDMSERLYRNFESLHNKRHNLIVEIVKDLNSTKKILEYCFGHGEQALDSDGNKTTLDDNTTTQTLDDNATIIDYCCGEGKLTQALAIEMPSVRKIAIDPFYSKLKKLKKLPNTRIVQMNPLIPDWDNIPFNSNFLILSEVIEHFDTYDRKQLIQTILNMKPDRLIITTPNKDANSTLGLEENQKRHGGHKIEYTKQEYIKEIHSTLMNHYMHYVVFPMTTTGDMIPKQTFDEIDEDLKNIPSFIVMYVFPKSQKSKFDQDRPSFNSLYRQLYLPASNITVSKKELIEGFVSGAFMTNYKNISFLQPTIPPVEYNNDYPDYLEHPCSAFQYYMQRGVTQLYGENKYMGANAQVIVFKTPELAKQMGFEQPIVITSRNGYRFFDNPDDEMKIYDDIKDKLEKDFYIFNGEMMPWSLKSKNYLLNEFIAPGEISLLARKRKQLSTDNIQQYLKVLSHYTKETKLEYRIFDVLACGMCSSGKFSDIYRGMFMPKPDVYKILDRFDCDIVKPVQRTIINLQDKNMIEDEIAIWKQYTLGGVGEGKVYKIEKFKYLPNGFMIQPYLKVRGKDYLRIIYGENYLEPDIFDEVKIRSIKMKRNQAIQEWEISMNILKTFLNRSRYVQLYIAAFIGCERVSWFNTDKTL